MLDVRFAHKNAFSILFFIEYPASSIQYHLRNTTNERRIQGLDN